jgi:hypothetical protein
MEKIKYYHEWKKRRILMRKMSFPIFDPKPNPNIRFFFAAN